MQYKVYKKEDFSTSEWSGGTTTQLAIYPADSLYANRDFVWRLSSATVDVVESDFTSLPDYDRVLLVLEGHVILAYEGVRTVKLGRLEYDYFDGAYTTKSYGKITDYNLMTRKDHGGKLELLSLTKENTNIELEPAMSRGFFAKDGYAIIKIDGETIMLDEGQQLVIEDCERLSLGVMGEGVLVCTEVNPKEGAVVKAKAGDQGTATDRRAGVPASDQGATVMGSGEQTVSEKSHSTSGPARKEISYKGYAHAGDPDIRGDIKFAYTASLTNFRGSRKIFKKLNTVWYDDMLFRAIEKIERIYLAVFIYVFGIAGLSCLILAKTGSTDGVGWVLLGWTIVHLLLISPALYYAVIPKPVKAHIKPVADLTEAEQKIQKMREQENPKLERILKKYKMSGKSEYFGHYDDYR